jgi:hypothetical protein
MSQKGKGAAGGKGAAKGKKAAGGKKVENDREDTLQAVVCSSSTALEKGTVLTLDRYLQIRSRRGSIPSHWRHQE